MTENFLHHLWKLNLFREQQLLTVEGEFVEIIKTGQHNCDAGPDFFNAQIRIENTLWAGNVEIHLKSSDWKNHGHEKDHTYDNVILHVVYKHDAEIRRKDGSLIPELELVGKFDERLWKNYNGLVQSTQWIPCQRHISKVDTLIINNWLDRLLTERLERKTEAIFSSLRLNNYHWEETFYQQLAKNFGFNLNALPFEMLAKSLPLPVLAKHKNHLKQLEAMLFGQAGMLGDNFQNEYPQELQREYAFLKAKFGLESVANHPWKFLRLRPVNFPTIRIAQFAQLVHRSSHLLSGILECESPELLESCFQVEVSDYWRNHFVFDRLSKTLDKPLGKNAIQTIIINTVVPFLFAYGKSHGSEIHLHRALKFLEEMPPEVNSVIMQWKETGIEAQSAYRSQALLQLKNEYCSEKKCLICSIGNKIISNTP